MTETEVWKALEGHYRKQNWTGVAVLADWFEEQEQAPLADTLRWLSRKGAADTEVIWLNSQNYWYSLVVNRSHPQTYPHDTFRNAVTIVHRDRTSTLEYLL